MRDRSLFLPVEKLKIGVPEVNGRPVAESAVPATASTTTTPSRNTATCTPVSATIPTRASM
jgi:hypothetical protein